MRFLFIFLFLGFQLSAQEYSLRKGAVMDSLAVSDTLDETFAIYLPSQYREGRLLPVLFIFDPQGRGRAAAQLFKPAAEEQGYIIASSNAIDPKEGLLENVKSGVRMIESVSASVPFDRRLMSVAGFAEGGRVASAMPYLYKTIHGVMAVGNHSMNFDLLKDVEKFAFVGIVGEERMSAHEMRFVTEELRREGFTSGLYTYKGGEEWPRAEIVSSALGLLSLEAMRKGLRPEDASLVERLYSEDMGQVNRLISTGQYVQAYDLMEVLQEKYDDLRDLSGLKDKQRQLRRSRNYQEQQEKYEQIRQEEMSLMADYIDFFYQDIDTHNFENLGWWNYQIRQLDATIAGEDEAEAAMAQRLKGSLRTLARNMVETYKTQETSLEAELLTNMLYTIYDQQAYAAYLRIIQLSAIDGDFPTAYFYLEELLKNGFKDRKTLYSLEGTLGLRLSRDFNWLVNKYLGSSRFYTELFEE